MATKYRFTIPDFLYQAYSNPMISGITILICSVFFFILGLKFPKIKEKFKISLAKAREAVNKHNQIWNQITKKEKIRYYSYMGLTISLIFICVVIYLSLHYFTELVFPIHILTIIPLLFAFPIAYFWSRWSLKFESMLESRLES